MFLFPGGLQEKWQEKRISCLIWPNQPIGPCGKSMCCLEFLTCPLNVGHSIQFPGSFGNSKYNLWEPKAGQRSHPNKQRWDCENTLGREVILLPHILSHGWCVIQLFWHQKIFHINITIVIPLVPLLCKSNASKGICCWKGGNLAGLCNCHVKWAPIMQEHLVA